MHYLWISLIKNTPLYFMKNILFLLLAAGSLFVSPAISLFGGIAFALALGSVFERHTHKISSLLLKIAVVGLGFGMNLMEALKSSSEGIVFTIFSVVIVMFVGIALARTLQINRKTGYLVSAGTAICGGSAIAAVAPVIKAKAHDTSIALGVVFTLNAIAMLIFPYIGHQLEMSQADFGMWAAIAIHDTSAVVGAAREYGEEALEIATIVKLSRALWIIPLSLISAWVFKKENGGEKSKISIPWFILLFIMAMVANTYFPLNEWLSNVIKVGSHKILSLTLFLIGSTLSLATIRRVGSKSIRLGVALWVLISVMSLGVIVLL